MPVTRKQQVLIELESTEGGGPATPFSSASAQQVYDPSVSDTVDQQDRVPAGPTLSRDFTPIGRKTRQVQFRSDFRGSGTPATAPDWGKNLRACGFKTASRIVKFDLGSASGSFQLGERITQASGATYGVVVGVFSSADAPKQQTDDNADYLIVAELAGTLASSTPTTGSVSGATDSTGTVAATTTRHVYQPTSEKLINVATSGAFSTGTPVAGVVLAVLDGSVTVGSVQVITVNSSTSFEVTLLWGEVLDTNTLDGGATYGTATINADPVMTRTPSLAIKHNFDGRDRPLLGARGDFTLDGEVGAPLQFAWTFSGDLGADADEAPIATAGLSTVRPPRLLGAICVYGDGTGVLRDMQTKGVQFSVGNTVSPNLDANRPGGATGSNVTDRDPQFVITTDMAHSTIDWEALRDAGTAINIGLVLGSTLGNIVAIVAPICQVTEVSIGDSDGVGTFDVTIKPRRIAESGDDELFICQL